VKYWLSVLLWMGIIFILSAQPSLPSLPNETADTILKKAGHFTEYAVLAALSARAFSAGRPLRRGDLWRALLLTLLYAASDEFHQSFVPSRTARLFDWGVDALGAGLALLVISRR
jgi:VanZ family protein